MTTTRRYCDESGRRRGHIAAAGAAAGAAAAAAADGSDGSDPDEGLPACDLEWPELTGSQQESARRLGWSCAAQWSRGATTASWAELCNADKLHAQLLGLTRQSWAERCHDAGSSDDSSDSSSEDETVAGVDEEDTPDSPDDGYANSFWPEVAAQGSDVPSSPLVAGAVD